MTNGIVSLITQLSLSLKNWKVWLFRWFVSPL